MKKLIISLILAFPLAVAAAPKVEWPLFGVQPIDTHWESWSNRFIALDSRKRLKLVDLVNGGEKLLLKKPFATHPDILKHFPLTDGDLVVAVFRQTKTISFYGFDITGGTVFAKTHKVNYRILEADVRINEKGEPTCLFYSERQNNFVVSLWQGGKNEDIFLSDEPIEKMVISWSDKTTHVVSRDGNELNWIKWQDGRIKKHRLPFFVSHPVFFLWQKRLYLSGIDIKGNLWRFTIVGGRLRPAKIVGNVKFRLADKIVTGVINKQLVILMPSSKTNSVWKIVLKDLGSNEIVGKVERKKIFWASKIHPAKINGKLHMLLETELGHLYLEPWVPAQPYIYDLRWKINSKKSPASLEITWKSKPRAGKVGYSYLLDHKKDSKPLPDFKLLQKNKVSFESPSEGFYGFHLQIAKPGSTKPEATYHVPIFWRYHPELPQLVLMKELGPRLVAPGKLGFFIENIVPAKYYAEVNSIPKYEPKKKLNVEKGYSKLKKKLKPGRYYLHVRARDKRSGLYSRTNHFLFFVDPYNPEQDESLIENNQKLSQVDFILKKIRQNKDNPAELQKWVRKLRELQKNVK